jgi:hypothetical protein
MHIITTIYCTELTLDRLSAHEPGQDAGHNSTMADSPDASREFLGVYQGKNRVLPMDRNE